MPPIAYDLAKELMDAGFPQGGNGTWKHNPRALVALSYDRVYAPTLEELIEACGKEFYRLHNVQTTWMADDVQGQHEACGDTPAEAVARLWLALNEE